MSTALVHSAPNIARQEFGATQVQTVHETAAQAVAAREVAAVQARYVVARSNPRDIEKFRVRLLKECERPGFAEDVEYSLPRKVWDPKLQEFVQKDIKGPTIRLIETALRCFTNIQTEKTLIYENADLRIFRVSVTDLESNLVDTADVPVSKSIERKGKFDRNSGKWLPPKGRIVVSERLNSAEEPVFLVLATDDELLAKQNALLSKAARTGGSRLLPRDVIAEAIEKARKVVADKDAKDPQAQQRALTDSFDSVGISTDDLREYLGHTLDRLQPAELTRLRGLYKAIRDGETTWGQVLEDAAPAEGDADKLADKKDQKIKQSKPQPRDTSSDEPPPQSDGADAQQPPEGDTRSNASEPRQQGGFSFGRK